MSIVTIQDDSSPSRHWSYDDKAPLGNGARGTVFAGSDDRNPVAVNPRHLGWAGTTPQSWACMNW